MGESLAKTGEAEQPRLRNLLKDRATRALGRTQGCSAEASPPAVSEGPGQAPEAPAAPVCSELSEATLIGVGQMVLLGLRMKRPGEGKGILGERQEGEKGPEGDGGTQVPVYTARWGLGAVCWPGCRQGKREFRVSHGGSGTQPSADLAPSSAWSTAWCGGPTGELGKGPGAPCDDGPATHGPPVKGPAGPRALATVPGAGHLHPG